MIRLYTLQRFAHFSPQDSIASAWFSHCMMFEKRMTKTQSFRNNHSLLRMDSYTYFPLHLLAHHWKRSCNLLNYARAHNSLWLRTEVSSMNHLSSPGFPKKPDNTGFPRCLNPPRCLFKLPPEVEPLINNLTSVMDFTQTQTTSTSIA